MIRANEMRDVFERHRENHAMLLVLMRRVSRPIDEPQLLRFEEEFTEIAGAIERHGHAVQALIDAAIETGSLTEHRSGVERRKPYDRRWHTS